MNSVERGRRGGRRQWTHTRNRELKLRILNVLFFKAHQHKAAGRKTRLDIQNYGCNVLLLL